MFRHDDHDCSVDADHVCFVEVDHVCLTGKVNPIRVESNSKKLNQIPLKFKSLNSNLPSKSIDLWSKC
jgi:hypothetical protein